MLNAIAAADDGHIIELQPGRSRHTGPLIDTVCRFSRLQALTLHLYPHTCLSPLASLPQLTRLTLAAEEGWEAVSPGLEVSRLALDAVLPRLHRLRELALPDVPVKQISLALPPSLRFLRLAQASSLHRLCALLERIISHMPDLLNLQINKLCIEHGCWRNMGDTLATAVEQCLSVAPQRAMTIMQAVDVGDLDILLHSMPVLTITQLTVLTVKHDDHLSAGTLTELTTRCPVLKRKSCAG